MVATLVRTAPTADDFVVNDLENNFIQIWVWCDERKTMSKRSKWLQIKIRTAKCNNSKATKFELIDSWDDEQSFDMQMKCTDDKNE